MASVDLSTEQLVDLVRRLPPERKRDVLVALAAGAQTDREQRMAYAEQQLRRVCAERGLNWDSMSEDEREALANDLVHEERSCRK